MDPATQASSKMDSRKAKEYFSGPMAKSMMANGQEARKMEAECGRARRETHT